MTDEGLRSHVDGLVVVKLVDGREVLGKLWQLRLSQAAYAIEQPASALKQGRMWVGIRDASEVEWVSTLTALQYMID
ncbi:MAG: hypothetical protein WAK84_01855 [Candidatus Cybelea sp.]